LRKTVHFHGINTLRCSTKAHFRYHELPLTEETPKAGVHVRYYLHITNHSNVAISSYLHVWRMTTK